MANEYVRGQLVRLTLSARRVDGTPPVSNPTTVTVRVTDPDSPAVSTDYTLAAAQVILDTTNNPFGDYYYDLATAGLADVKLGWWIYSWFTTGTPTVAEKNTFRLVSEKVR